MTSIIIQRGRLTWASAERRSDRYGSVQINDEHDNPKTLESFGLDGTVGRLVCVVTETRQSKHIGDLARGIFPKTPKIGDRIVLGEGELFVESCSSGLHEEGEHERADTRWMGALFDAIRSSGVTLVTDDPAADAQVPDKIGLRPLDGRKSDWLDPEQLYRVHNQDVELIFDFDGPVPKSFTGNL